MDKILSDSSFYSRGLIEKSSGWQHYDTYSPKIYNEYIDQYNELALCNFENLTIRAVDECTFVVDSARSYIIKFINCKNITLENLCFNHRQSGFSNRGSIGISSCAQVRFRNIETKSLLGNGIVISDSEEIEISDSYLTNACGSQVRIENSSKVRFNDCAFLRNNTALYVDYNSKDVSLNECEFINNLNTLFELNSIITLNTCEIQHKFSDLGDLDDALVMFVNNTSNIRPCIDKYLVNEYLRENSPAVGVEIIDSISTKNGLTSILGVKLPEYRIEVSEYMDVDSIPVKVVECYMHPKIEEEQWEDLNSAILNAQAQYVPENQPDITRRGWTSAENMNIPAHVNENTQVRIETSNKYEQKITIEYRANPNDKYSTKEAVSNLISSKLGLNLLTTDFEITSYIKDFHVVLKLNENAMNKILSIVRKSDSWGSPRYAPEGHHAYYDYDNKWQAEIHEDTYMLQLSRSWNIYGEYNY